LILSRSRCVHPSPLALVPHSCAAMFETKVAAILNAQLGAYVLGLDAEALKIGVWSGKIVLENLQARITASLTR
jgi:hypothetical protein